MWILQKGFEQMPQNSTGRKYGAATGVGLRA